MLHEVEKVKGHLCREIEQGKRLMHHVDPMAKSCQQDCDDLQVQGMLPALQPS